MKILEIADLHLSEAFSRDVRDSQSEALSEVFQAYREHGCTCLKILGDTIHDKSFLYTTSLNILDTIIRENSDINFEFLIGNHDFAGSTKDHGFHSFSRADNVTIIDEPRISQLSTGQIIVDLPYSKNLKKIVSDFSGDYLFSHFGVNEAVVRPGFSVSHAVRFSDLQAFKEVHLGHYHLPQELTVAETTVRYIGSLVSRDWSDKNQQKRYLITDTESGDIISYNVKSSLQFIESEVASIEELRELEKEYLRKPTNTFQRVVSTIPLDSEILPIILKASESLDITMDFSSETPSHALIEKWVKSELSDPQLTSDEVLSYGLSIITRAKAEEDALLEQDSDV